MKEQIQNIPWETLESNLEDSALLAEMFLKLLDKPQTDHEVVLQDILNAIYCDGASFEATPIVIPFLLTFSEHAQDDEIFTLLISFSQLIRDTKELFLLQNRDRSYIIQLYKTFFAGVPLYHTWLGSHHREVRMLSAYMLSQCDSSVPDIVLHPEMDLILPLKQCYALEKDEVVRFTLIKAITTLQGFSEDEIFIHFTSATNALERFALALAITTIAPEKIAPEFEKVLQVFLHLHENEQLEDAYTIIPYPYDVVTDILQVCDKINKEKSTTFLCNALAQWEEDTMGIEEEPEQATLVAVTEKLLDLTSFARGGELAESKREKDGTYIYRYRMFHGASAIKDPPVVLSLQQKQALQSILHCEAFWQIRTTLLQAYALPTEKQAFKEYLATH